MKKTSAFTLIELLVVMSIIRLLVSILLPSLASARQTAQMTQCTLNQRQVGLAMYAYAGDSRETYVPWRSLIPGSAGYYYWPGRLLKMRRLSTPSIYVCPSFADPALATHLNSWNIQKFAPDNPAVAYYYQSVHYGYNWNNIGSAYNIVDEQTGYAAALASERTLSSTRPYPSSARASDLKQASSTVLISDTIRYATISTGQFAGYCAVDDHRTTQYIAHARHQNGRTVTLAWADGHASNLPTGSSTLLAGPANPTQYDPYEGPLGEYAAGTRNHWGR